MWPLGTLAMALEPLQRGSGDIGNYGLPRRTDQALFCGGDAYQLVLFQVALGALLVPVALRVRCFRPVWRPPTSYSS